jgi:molecular chaperone HtpG
VQQLLHLMIHSLYSKKEIFLRELLSNASDALDTLRFLALTRPELRSASEGNEPAIDISVDKDQRTLSISDNGIGMTREQVISDIGTIARSGSSALVRKLKELKEQGRPEASSLELIGQFGLGFYSAFMVADRVELETLSAEPGAQPVHWLSTGGGSYTVGPGERRAVGTKVTLHLNQDSSEFLEDWRIEGIVKEYSNYVKWPIRMGQKQLNRATALWAKRPAEVSDAEYLDFYKQLMGGFSEEQPLSRLHLQMDAPYQFQALVYIPSRPPFDILSDRDKRHGMQLYVRRVFILDHAEELLPLYLRFVRGVVDSEDLPLNVSREILQKNQVISAIQKQLTKKVLEELKRIKENKPDAYRAFWDEFGVLLKEGLYLDAGNRDKIAEITLWSTLNTEAGQRISLPDYVAKMPAGQDEIYYITGPSRQVVEASPHIEALRKLKLDVLLLTDPIDEWVVQGLTEYSGKKLRAIHMGNFKLPDIKVDEAEPPAEKKSSPEQEQQLGSLVAHLRVRFQEQLKEVRLSSRLTDSPSVLVTGEGDLSPNLEQILLRANRKVPTSKPILEINPYNALVQQLARLLATAPASEDVATYSDLLLELAYLAQAAVPHPAQLLSALNRVLLRDIQTLAPPPSP